MLVPKVMMSQPASALPWRRQGPGVRSSEGDNRTDGKDERVARLQYAREPAVALQSQLQVAGGLLRRQHAADEQRRRGVEVLHQLAGHACRRGRWGDVRTQLARPCSRLAVPQHLEAT